MNRVKIGLIGFGEVGTVMVRDLGEAAVVTVYDVRFDDPADGLKAKGEAAMVACAGSLAEAASGQDLVISAVTAANAERVSQDAAPYLGGAYFVDLNSVAPGTRTREAAHIDGGGRYVEAAVMAPIAPKRVATPILLGGPNAESVAPLLGSLGFNAKVFSAEVGRASAVKMCRSIFIKGLESIVSESLLAARRYGVEQDVISTLSNTVPHEDWPALARYLITRTLIHGKRRSEEMEEVVETIGDVGLPSWMSQGAVKRQRWAADLAIEDSESLPLEALLDLMIATAGAPAGEH